MPRPVARRLPGRSHPSTRQARLATALLSLVLGTSVLHAQDLPAPAAAVASEPTRASAASDVKPATSGLGPRLESGPRGRFTPGEDLVGLINGERARVGLPLVSWSPSLARVAEAHAVDLERNTPVGSCNAHSWSDQGPWSSCCYTNDGAKAQCMWDKPREISRGVYPGHGYEIAAWSGGRITPGVALKMWQGSPNHLSVMLNQGVWSDRRWRAMGAALSLHHAVVWFGEEADPAPKDR